MTQITMQTLSPELTLAMPLRGVKLIEASAGTGKTYTIANLYLRYVLDGKKTSEILVVTFTKAATDELKARIQQRLVETLRHLKQQTTPGSDEFLKQLLTSLRDCGNSGQAIVQLQLAVRTMETTAIFTIHGFCQRALTDHAFFSQQPFEVKVATDDSELWQDALKDWWRKNVYTENKANTALLTSTLINTEAFIKLQRNLRTTSARLQPECKQTKEDLFSEWAALEITCRKLQKDWQQQKREIEQILTDSPALSRGEKAYRKKDTLLTDLIILNKYFQAEDWYILPKIFHKYTSQGLEDNSTKTKRGTDEALNNHPFFKDCQIVWDSYAQIKKNLLVLSLNDATSFASEQIEVIKQRSQTISFNDQLAWLNTALNGETGAELAKSLREHFPVAMIDEFQDTDSIQYNIFKSIYLKQPGKKEIESHNAFIMIGDPKQAIYKFRGGDIFTYIQAKNDVSEFYTLDTNWRSTPGIVESTNTIFGFRDRPFIYEEAFTYQNIKAAKKNAHPILTNKGKTVTPVTLWNIPIGKTRAKVQKNSLTTKNAATEFSVDKTSDEIARLIEAGNNKTLLLGSNPVVPANIAVLVRNRYDGNEVRQALQKRGIQSVTIGRENIYKCEEYTGLQRLLKAVYLYSDRFTARAGLSSSLLNHSYSDIADIIDDEDKWLAWLSKLQELNLLWQKKGFMAMFQSLLHELEIGKKLASNINAERQLTNLIHLAELIQQASRSHSGIDALYNWLVEKADDPGNEESELRLESDQNLVQIVTIHKSKGLEYPIVFLPFMWSCRGFQLKDTLIEYHDENNNAFIHADISNDKPAEEQAIKENMAEDIRLAYVALTRASSKIYLSWGATTSRQCSAIDTGLGYLLHAGADKEQIKSDTALPYLQNLVAQSNNSIHIQETVDETPTKITIKNTPTHLNAATFDGTSKSDWRLASFSSLTRDVHQTHHGGSARTGNDPILDFPAGSHVGLFLHHILENLNFIADVEAQTETIMHEVAVRYDLDIKKLGATVHNWMDEILNTSLDGKQLTLASLDDSHRLNEMGFDFSTQKVDINKLNTVLNDSTGQALTPVSYESFSGMVTGFIDLIFEYEGKYYVCDYKSNFLGGALEDYSSNNLKQAILDRRYDLQYLLYTLALHRYLKTRIKGYDYDTHMGGSYYLFLRAMRKQHGNKYGVYYDKPSKPLIASLDKIFTPAEALAPDGASTC